MEFHVVIPARYASERLPGKPLREIAGKPMIQHVYECAVAAGAAGVIVATDDARIEQAVAAFGGDVCMTAATHRSGSERLAEVVTQRGYPDDQVIVNLQGDEPLMPPALVRQVAQNLHVNRKADLATLCFPVHSASELFDPHVVKVVFDAGGYALYFSRAPVPWDRDAFASTTDKLPEGCGHYRHVGLYAYRAGYLKRYATLSPSPLEKLESLEQLRVLWHGGEIHVAVAESPPGHGVDTPADLDSVAVALEKRIPLDRQAPSL